MSTTLVKMDTFVVTRDTRINFIRTSQRMMSVCVPQHTHLMGQPSVRPFATRVGELECCEREHQAPNGDCLYPLAWLVLVSDQ